jgi:hypothetical protein
MRRRGSGSGAGQAGGSTASWPSLAYDWAASGRRCTRCWRTRRNLIYGLPVRWVEVWMTVFYNGRAGDINGKPIGTEYKPGDFKSVPIDPDDPPLYESQAAYLERHGLFLPGARRRLRKADFEPQAVRRSTMTGART